MVALAGEGILGPTCTYLLLSSECFSFYNDIMINAGHDLCLCKMLGDFPKSKVCRHPNHYKEEFAFKGRKQEFKEIGRSCGVT
jgi:hypothetical protein